MRLVRFYKRGLPLLDLLNSSAFFQRLGCDLVLSIKLLLVTLLNLVPNFSLACLPLLILDCYHV